MRIARLNPPQVFIGAQCFGCQEYGHMKSECPTYLKSKGKTMAVTFSDDDFLMMSLVVTRMETSLLSLLLL